MAEIKAFLFTAGEFKVIEIDEDTTQQPGQDATIKVCNPREEIRKAQVTANPGVRRFYIDSSNEEDVANFDANFKEIV
jgi:hypothetical protein